MDLSLICIMGKYKVLRGGESFQRSKNLLTDILWTAVFVHESYNHTSMYRDQFNDSVNGTHSRRIELIGHEEFCDIYVSEGKKTIYVVFMGTNSDHQWTANIFTSLVGLWDWDMNNMASLFAKKIVGCVSGLQLRDFKFVISGHSRGGALAMYTAQVLHNNYSKKKKINVARVITFGAAKVSYSVDFDPPYRVHRVINESDIVPHFPIGIFCKHVGHEVSFRSDDGDSDGNLFAKGGESPHSTRMHLDFARSLQLKKKKKRNNNS